MRPESYAARFGDRGTKAPPTLSSFENWLGSASLYSGSESLDRRPKLTSLPTSSCIKCDSRDEGTPFWTKPTVIQQGSWALFEPHVAAVTVADPAPVHVRDNMIEGDIILPHQAGRELRGALDRSGDIVAPVHTHFDPDGRPVARAFVVSMFSGFVGRQALVNRMIVHREMPGKKSGAIVATPEPVFHRERVVQRVGAPRRVVGRMNSDKCRTHRPMHRTSAFPRRDDVLGNFQFACAGGGQAADGNHYEAKRGAVDHVFCGPRNFARYGEPAPARALASSFLDPPARKRTGCKVGETECGRVKSSREMDRTMWEGPARDPRISGRKPIPRWCKRAGAG